MSGKYLRAFFEEKGLDEQVYQVEAKGGTTNWICTADVIDALLNASDNIQTKAADILRLIDQANGDPHSFLRHLAQGMAFDLEDMK